MATVYSYLRFSSKRQADGDSTRRQLEGQRWIEKNGHTLANMVLQDRGVSAFRGKNAEVGALGRFLEEIEAGNVKPGSILLVEALDRLSRQGVSKAQQIFMRILDSGVDIVCLMPYEMRFTKDSVNDLVGLLLPLIAFHLAHLESQQKSLRVSEHWVAVRKKVEEKKFVGRKIPGWITWTGERYEMNKHAEALKATVQWVLDGWTVGRVIRELNAKYPPMGRKPYWSWTHLRRVLSERVILGERQQYRRTEKGRVPIGEPVVGYYPAVIDEETWLRVQHALKKLAQAKSGPATKFVNLFAGIAVNGYDGHSMVMTGSKTSRKTKAAYRDRVLVSLGTHCHAQNTHRIPANYHHVEIAILTHLRSLGPAALRRDNVRAEELARKEQVAAGLAERIAVIEQAVQDADLAALPNMIRMLGDLSRQRDALVIEVEQLRHEVEASNNLDRTQKLLDLVASVSGDEAIRLRLRVRAMLRDIVKQVAIYPNSYLRRRHGVVEVKLRAGFQYILAYGEVALATSPNAVICSENVKDEVIHDMLATLRKNADAMRAPTSDDSLPDDLGGLVDCYFKELRAKGDKGRHSAKSYATKFLTSVGNIAAGKLKAKHWQTFSNALDQEVADRKRSRGSAQTYRSGARAFVRWLQTKSKVEAFTTS